jgi:hypothetical protein
MYKKMKGKSKSKHPIWINKKNQCDLMWFHNFFQQSSGIFLLKSIIWDVDEADLVLYSDACPSGMEFYSPVLAKGCCVSPSDKLPNDIFFLEALTILIQVHWATQLPHIPHRLVVYCDNTNSIAMFNSMRGEGYNNGILILASD